MERSMADGVVHTVYKGGQWLNEIEGGSEFGGAHRRRKKRSERVVAGHSRTRPSM